MRPFDRLHRALSRWPSGVHHAGPPATRSAISASERRIGAALHADHRDLLSRWNGLLLFHDEIAIFGVAGSGPELDRLELEIEGERTSVALGRNTESLFLLDERGRVVALDEETRERRVEGSRLEAWVDAVMAREAILYDAAGEFRGNAFSGSEISRRAERLRARAGVRADPRSPAWRVELAALLEEEGDLEGACRELAVALGEAPEDKRLESLLAHTRARTALRPVARDDG